MVFERVGGKASLCLHIFTLSIAILVCVKRGHVAIIQPAVVNPMGVSSVVYCRKARLVQPAGHYYSLLSFQLIHIYSFLAGRRAIRQDSCVMTSALHKSG